MTAPVAGLCRAISNAQPPPCEVFACALRAACKDKRLSCEAFALYVHTGRALSPCTRVTMDSSGQHVLKGLSDKPQPTVKVFARLFTHPLAGRRKTAEREQA